jgi:predicted nucleotide-binding protein
MSAITMKMLRDFIGTARGQTQSEILKAFLRLVIFKSGLSESGSIMIWHKADGKLHLFNEEEFLFKEKYLDPSREWKEVFDNWEEGLAGYAFGSQHIQYSEDVSNDPRFAFFSGHDPIRSMVCVPIQVRSLEKRFGVASFHNASAVPLNEEKRDIIEVAVGSLGLALNASAARLTSQSVFIVHGRDMGALNALQTLLLKRGVDTLTLADQPRTGEALLQKLDELVNACCAGFVLLTPDDVGRLVSSKKTRLKTRARQNVVFEGGLLFGRFGAHRICFLLADPDLELPSDIKGILYEPFDMNRPSASGIEDILTKWGIKWTRPAAVE